MVSRYRKKLMYFLLKIPLVRILASSYLSSIIYYEYRVMKALSLIIVEIEEDLSRFTEAFDMDDMTEAIKIIKKELDYNKLLIHDFKHALITRLPFMSVNIRTQEAAANIVIEQQDIVEGYAKVGMVDDEFAEEWETVLHKKMDNIKSMDITGNKLEKTSML